LLQYGVVLDCFIVLRGARLLQCAAWCSTAAVCCVVLDCCSVLRGARLRHSVLRGARLLYYAASIMWLDAA
jgi:hypothetical protein